MSIKYIGMDVRKETISIAVMNSATRSEGLDVGKYFWRFGGERGVSHLTPPYIGLLARSTASSYSPRKASMGSVLEARLAGSAEAASASSSIAMAESASTPGSNGLTSNNKERSKRDTAKAPSKPKPQPTAASLAPELRMTNITPERWQPSAMRTAISGSRSATENAITP